LHLPPGVLRKRDASGRSDAFDARRDVDAIAKNIVAFDDDVADIDADAELDRIGFGSAGIVLANVLLDLDRTGNASTALPNSTSMPSPISLTIRPEWAPICGSTRSRRKAFKRASVPASSIPMRRE